MLSRKEDSSRLVVQVFFLGGGHEFLGVGGGCWVPRASLTPATASAQSSSGPRAQGRQQLCPEKRCPSIAP